MAEKLRIMQITDNLGIGGLERVVTNICKHLDPHQFTISACCLSFRGPFAEELEKDGIKVHLTPRRKDRTDYFVFWSLKNILRDTRPHIVHTHNANALLDGFLASLLAMIPVKIHTDHARQFPDKKRIMLAEWCISNFLDHIVAVSEETKANLINHEHICKDKISVVNNGIDGSRYDIEIDREGKRKALGLDNFRHIIGLGVRLAPQKGISYLIQAAPSILKRFPDTAFIVAGDGFLMNPLKEEVNRLRLEKNFFFLGPRLDLPEILQLLDVYVLPSVWEGLPLAILEAMAARRAIIATDVGGTSAAIDHGKTGYLIPPKAPVILAERVCELLSNPSQRELFSRAAHRKFYTSFEVKHMANEYAEIYLRAAHSKGLIGK